MTGREMLGKRGWKAAYRSNRVTRNFRCWDCGNAASSHQAFHGDDKRVYGPDVVSWLCPCGAHNLDDTSLRHDHEIRMECAS